MQGGMIMKRLLALGLFLALTNRCAAQEIPAPPKPDAVFPEWQAVTDTPTAQKLFAPMDGSRKVERRPDGAVLLPVNFKGTTHARVSWDLRIKTDLRLTRGVQFDFYCSDLTPFSSFSLYFRSGGGWYHASFSPEKTGVWEHIVIDKADAPGESTVAGWGAVDMLRLSGWRCLSTDTVCAIANLGPVDVAPEVLVIRADSSAKKQKPNEGFALYAGTVSSTLDALGIPSAQAADTDLTPDLLSKVSLVVLPYNPKVPAGMAGLLRGFVGRGGKLLVCYSLPSELEELIGLKVVGGSVAEDGAFAGFARTAQGLATQPAFAPQASWRTTDTRPAKGTQSRVIAVWRDAKSQDTARPAVTLTASGAFMGHVWLGGKDSASLALMRAIVGEMLPDMWRKSADQAFAQIGVIGDAADFEAFRTTFRNGKPSRQARREFARAEKARDEARELLKAGQWTDSIGVSGQAAEAALRAWFLTQPSRAQEHRAFWCHSAFGLRNKNWDASIRFLKENGFNAILPNMLWGGTAYYPSKVLPEYAQLAEKGDQIAQCLAACKKYGVQCHVWKVNWNTGNHAPKAFIDRMAAEGRAQKLYSGETKEAWLCPSHPANQDLEVASMLEIARNYEVDGVHFDYIRYPDNNSCFCDGCRSRFEAVLGHAVEKWPEDTRKNEAVRAKWLDFRRSAIDAVVRRVAEEARKIRPGIQVSAAVFRNWTTDRDNVGQDWKMWCEKGWLDFVCPMDYIGSNAIFKNVVTAQKELAGKARLYPGIGLSCWKNPDDAVKLAQQIDIVRKLDVPGYTVFNYDAHAEAVLPHIRLGVTSK